MDRVRPRNPTRSRWMQATMILISTSVAVALTMNKPVSTGNFEQYYNQMAANSGYKFQKEYYSELGPIGVAQSTSAGMSADNIVKNRYSDVLPYDHSRVKLRKTGKKGIDYINANFIPGYNSPREYIATQGPLPTTKEDFWRLVWEQNSTTIVMVTQCVEKGRVKSEHYWPFDSKPTMFGDITVTMTTESVLQEWTVRDFYLEKNHEKHSVRHFQFTAWPDHGVPESSSSVLRFVRTVRGQLPKKSGPIVVHCSAGVGRSGTFITLDVLLQQLAMKEDDSIDIFGIVANLRQNRCYMVQTDTQYVFIHRAILDILQGRVSDKDWLLTPSVSTLKSDSRKINRIDGNSEHANNRNAEL
ncbi:receptor-type tyrosine-protein phosphatase O-like [Ptychodera flava]|uniref:receptor-type tyrosine-protein phosphatase O-like n=1 Tax=Ptychodera flava TaxID=63121 RepID=UPI00396A9794